MTASQLETRSFEVRETAPESRTFAGIAVPWDTPADIAGLFTERVERGAVEVPASGRVLLYWRHAEPIGVLTKWTDAAEGWRVEARISQTPRGEEAYTLLRDGVIGELSIGFVPLEHREDDATGEITRTRIEVREVSLVPFGAYGADAPVTDVRAKAAGNTDAAPAAERQSIVTDTITAAEAVELRESIEELSRSVSTLASRNEEPEAVDTRSAGEVLKAIAAGDEASIRSYEGTLKRAYTGGTTADTVSKAGWVGDLTRLFDASSGALANVFGQGTLPESGMSIEYAQLKSNTITVTEQENEGDPIALGKVQIETKTAPVKTYAGGTELTRQEIERSSVNVVNTSLEALAVAAAARKKAVLRAAFNAAVTAREAIATNGGVVVLGATLASSTALQWTNVVVDAAVKLEPENLGIDALIVSPSIFKRLNALETTGHRVFKVSDTERGIGELNLPGLEGNLAGIRVVADTGLAADAAAFVNGRAIKQYDSPLVSLQDDTLITLSKTFAVYRYGAVATEIPAGIVPVKLAAS